MGVIDSLKADANSLWDSILKIGSLGGFGDIVFTVNPLKTMTFKDAEHTSSVEYAEHKIIGDKPKLEYMYQNADEVSMNITLSGFAGVNPKEELKKFDEYMQDGDIYPLIIGNAAIEDSNVLGWFVITSLSKRYKDIIFTGDITQVELTVKFKEYPLFEDDDE